MKSTHTMSLEVMAGVMPLKLRFEQLALRILVRFSVSNPLVIDNFKTLAETRSKSKIQKVYNDFVTLEVNPSTLSATISSLPESYSSLFHTDTSLREESKTIPESLRQREIPGTFMKKFGHVPPTNTFFTDGSLQEHGTGFGVFNATTEACFKLEQPCSIYTAELAAIFYALMLISVKPPGLYYIFTDSYSSVEALRSVKAIRSPDYFIQRILELLTTMFENAFRISLVWIPSHCGIMGNEKADALAKKGALEGSLFSRQIPPHEFLLLPKRLCLDKWQRDWDAGELGRFHYSIAPQVSLRPWYSGLSVCRAFIRMMSRLRSNHFALGAHLERIGLASSKACACGTGYHDLDHLLWSCVDFNASRPALIASVEAAGRPCGTPVRDILAGRDVEYMLIIYRFASENGIAL